MFYRRAVSPSAPVYTFKAASGEYYGSKECQQCHRNALWKDDLEKNPNVQQNQTHSCMVTAKKMCSLVTAKCDFQLVPGTATSLEIASITNRREQHGWGKSP